MRPRFPHARATPITFLIVFASAASSLLGQTATLTAPERAVVGSAVTLSWTGPFAAGDFISIDPAGAPSSQYGTYIYANIAQPGALKMPDAPGSYELRYHMGSSGYAVVASRPIEVTDVEAAFDPLGPVDAGAQVSVVWRGPAYPGDFISIDSPGAPERDYGPYAYTNANPALVRAPEAAGAYMVRYHLASSYRVIGQTPLTVGSVSAEIAAAAEAQAGSEVSITWQGPNASLDYVSVDPEGAPATEYGPYAYTSAGSPLMIRLPEEPGSYAIRYHLGSGTVIGSRPIRVLPNTATVAGPSTVVGATDFEVSWTGPDNLGDYVTIVPAGAEPRDYLDYAYTREGATVTLQAPLDAGPHELRYMTGRSRQVLASIPVAVTPGAAPGSIRVIGEATGVPGPGSGAVEIVLDASGSMLQRIDGVRRIELAKDALNSLVGEIVPTGTPFALRVFGHREAGSCRTDLEIPLAPLASATAATRIGAIQALNLAKTPIAASLALVGQDLAGARGPVVVVLVTDGEETCEGDPAAAIDALRDSGMDVRVNIVGFAIDEQQLRETFQEWSRLGNGRYVEANDGAELADAMRVALATPFEVLSGDEVVGTGVVNGPAVRLAPGTYRVRLLGTPPRELPPVTVDPEGDHSVSVEPSR